MLDGENSSGDFVPSDFQEGDGSNQQPRSSNAFGRTPLPKAGQLKNSGVGFLTLAARWKPIAIIATVLSLVIVLLTVAISKSGNLANAMPWTPNLKFSIWLFGLCLFLCLFVTTLGAECWKMRLNFCDVHPSNSPDDPGMHRIQKSAQGILERDKKGSKKGNNNQHRQKVAVQALAVSNAVKSFQACKSGAHRNGRFIDRTNTFLEIISLQRLSSKPTFWLNMPPYWFFLILILVLIWPFVL
jgi:hypothetical protein